MFVHLALNRKLQKRRTVSIPITSISLLFISTFQFLRFFIESLHDDPYSQVFF